MLPDPKRLRSVYEPPHSPTAKDAPTQAEDTDIMSAPFEAASAASPDARDGLQGPVAQEPDAPVVQGGDTEDEEDDEEDEEGNAYDVMINRCTVCNVDMGACNGRQLCGKWQCDNEWMIEYEKEEMKRLRMLKLKCILTVYIQLTFLLNRAAEKAYAPGGIGYTECKDDFVSHMTN